MAEAVHIILRSFDARGVLRTRMDAITHDAPSIILDQFEEELGPDDVRVLMDIAYPPCVREENG